jgi:uncharacterized protein (DUF111 family)
MLAMVNVDNIAGDILPYVIDSILEIGAKNVHCIQALTKKGRLGYLFLIDTEEEFLDPIADFLAQEVGTLGMRVLENQHRRCDYTIQPVRLSLQEEIPGSSPACETVVDVKLIFNAHGEVTSARAEYKHIEAACKELRARGYSIPFLELKARAELAALEAHSSQSVSVHVEAVAQAPESSRKD